MYGYQQVHREKLLISHLFFGLWFKQNVREKHKNAKWYVIQIKYILLLVPQHVMPTINVEQTRHPQVISKLRIPQMYLLIMALLKLWMALVIRLVSLLIPLKAQAQILHILGPFTYSLLSLYLLLLVAPCFNTLKYY